MSHWREKVVVVTGGSAGLGLVVAEEFAEKNATVVIISRNIESLENASKNSDQQLNTIVGDVCDNESVAHAVEEIKTRFGRIDVWINNVGKSTRSALDSCSMDEYRDLMEVNFFSAVRCTSAVMQLLEASSGSVVFIGSLASKTGWRNMSPYSTSKHALAAFSHQVRLESPANVHSLFVCCGPIKRIDSGKRYQKEAASLDEAAKEPGAGVRLKGLDPKKLASQIESAIRRRKSELIVPFYARLLFAIQQLSPSLGDWILRRFGK